MKKIQNVLVWLRKLFSALHNCVKLDEQNPKCAGLAQEIVFGSA
jgi:hypothetical protein